MHYWLLVPVLLVALVAVVGAYGLMAYRRHKKKDTEIRVLKENFKQAVQQTCEAASKGDSDATLKLEALKDTLEAQSVRLTGRPKPPTTIIQGGITQ